MGLKPEVFIRRNALPSAILSLLTPLELELFTGEPVTDPKGKEHTPSRRGVELNDLASDPDRFVGWLEASLVRVISTASFCPIPHGSRPRQHKRPITNYSASPGNISTAS